MMGASLTRALRVVRTHGFWLSIAYVGLLFLMARVYA
jgi:hypothetical protein